MNQVDWAAMTWMGCTHVKVLFQGTQIMQIFPAMAYGWAVQAAEGAERYCYRPDIKGD